MTPRMWIVLVVAAALAAVATIQCSGPAVAVVPVVVERPSAPAQAAAASADVPGPAVHRVVEQPAAPWPAGQTAAASSSAASGPAMSSSAALDVAVGPEGYGPRVDDALRRGGVKAAGEAARLISMCMQVAGGGPSLDELRHDPRIPNEMFTFMFEAHQIRLRNCQTVTPAHIAEESRLHLLAMGSERGHAATYLMRFGVPADVSVREHVGAALKRDAERGDWTAMRLLARDGASFGLAPLERYIHGAAYVQLMSLPPVEIPLHLPLADRGSLDAADPAAVDSRVKALVQAAMRPLQQRD